MEKHGYASEGGWNYFRWIDKANGYHGNGSNFIGALSFLIFRILGYSLFVDEILSFTLHYILQNTFVIDIIQILIYPRGKRLDCFISPVGESFTEWISFHLSREFKTVNFCSCKDTKIHLLQSPPHTRTITYGERAFSIRAPRLKFSAAKDQASWMGWSLLKQYLFKLAFDWWLIRSMYFAPHWFSLFPLCICYVVA